MGVSLLPFHVHVCFAFWPFGGALSGCYVLRVTYDVPVLKHASANQACLISPALSERGQNGILKASSKCSTHGKKERESACSRSKTESQLS